MRGCVVECATISRILLDCRSKRGKKTPEASTTGVGTSDCWYQTRRFRLSDPGGGTSSLPRGRLSEEINTFIASPPSEGAALPAIRRGRGEHFASDNGRRMFSWAWVLVDGPRNRNSVVGLIAVLLNSIPVMFTPTTNIVLFRWLLGLANRDFRRMRTATSAPSSKAKFADREGASRRIASETGSRDCTRNPQTSRRISASKTVHPCHRYGRGKPQGLVTSQQPCSFATSWICSQFGTIGQIVLNFDHIPLKHRSI
jgi:hypothetical protein